MTISIEGIEYTVVKMSHIILEAQDHSLMFEHGWDYLKTIYGDMAYDEVERYIHDHIKEAIRVTE